MPELCPMSGGLNWNNGTDIPSFCLDNCEPIWVKAKFGMPNLDIFDETCEHDVEFEDESLQRMEGSKRIYGILSTCIVDGTEAFSETWEFDCPKN